jgi:hypothetical protein
MTQEDLGMRRTLKIGFTFAAVLGLSAATALAYVDTVYTPRAPNGPLYAGKVMVKRHDLASNPGKPVPGTPDKPRPILESRVSVGKTMPGYRTSVGGGVALASQSPQSVLETRLKSLANDLR